MKASILQINNSFSGQNYLPYSAAILESYFKGHSSSAGEFSFLSPIYKRDSVGNIVNAISGTGVLGLSLYAWNCNLSLAVAKRFKAENPETIIFAGGPSVPDNAEEFLRKNPFIDIAVHNEGEIPVKMILESIAGGGSLDGIPSTSRLAENSYLKLENISRIEDLGDIPSPFLTGSLDRLIKENPSESWIGLWETNRGCPFTCTYCDWGSATGSKKIGMFQMERLTDEIEWFSKNKIEYLFCCDANFGMFPRDPEIAKLVGDTKVRTGYPHALSVQNTKNSTDRSFETQKILCDYGLNKGVTLSMQTLSETSLKFIKRSNIRLSSYFELQNRFIDQGVPTYSDLILALPGESLESFIDGMSTLIENGQHNRIQFNNLSILPNAEMAKPEYREKYEIRTVITDIVNMHGSKSVEDKEVIETQELVIQTNTLSFEDWVAVRSIAWLISFLYFNKVAQVPLVVANGGLGVPFSVIVRSLMNIGPEYPLLNQLIHDYKSFAIEISEGGPEYIHSVEHLDIFWPPDELNFIDYTLKDGFRGLYDELNQVLVKLVQDHNEELHDFFGADAIGEIFSEAFSFNEWLLSRPAQEAQGSFLSKWNIPEYYSSKLKGQFDNIRKLECGIVYELVDLKSRSLDNWLKEVVWYGNKRGAYLNNFQLVR